MLLVDCVPPAQVRAVSRGRFGELDGIRRSCRAKENPVIGTILLIILLLMLIGALPTWPHSRSWGYYPSGGLGLVLVIILILVLLGRI